ncbi:endonuclease/exonuclease/phosphatase family protein [Phenylobacterium sp.]|uniref:endonuclease/exonuclease/phosphatase family protein n=1 Tax=Phenylobacterium sp. TaxID=1871053 RepID=UPI002ED82A67
MGRVLRDGLGAIAFVSAFFAAAGAGLGLGGDFDWRLDVLTHFAPIYAAVGLLAALAGVAAGRQWRRPAVLLGVVAVLCAAGLMWPEYTRYVEPTAPPAAPSQIKIVQFNAFKKNIDLRRVVAWIAAQDPDIVTLQEARHDLRDALVKRMGYRVAGGKEHVMILSRRQRLRMVRPPLEASPLTYVNATYPSASGPFEVVTTHLDWPLYDTHPRQLADLASVVARRPRERMILTGDFNAAPWSFGLRRMDGALGLSRRDRALFSFPARVDRWDGAPPALPIDHVYAGSGWRTVSIQRGPSLGSDHYPVVVILAPR